ncbi:alpha/beta hydrolase family esterase [Corynebacterium frankenforstense]
MKILRDLRALAVAALAAGAMIAAPGQVAAQEAPEPAPAPAAEAPAPAPAPAPEAPAPEAPAPEAPAPEPPAAEVPPAPPAPVAPPVTPGTDGELDLGGRSYVIHVPAEYTPERAWPVLGGYSAYQDSTENFRNYSRLRESTAGREAIIVYPRSIGGSWEGSPTAMSRPGEDIAFTRAMIDDVAGKYTVDRARVYATGLSTGGGMAMVAACHMPDVAAAVAPVSGAYYNPVNMTCPGGCARETEQIRVLGSNHLWWLENPNTTEEIWTFLARQHK